MVGLDTNLLFYANDSQNSAKKHRARDLLGRASSAKAIVAQQVLGEFVHAARKLRMLDRTEIAAFAADIRGSFDIVPSSIDDFDAGLDAHVVHGIPFWDAFIWATVRSAGCRWLLTEDYQDGRSLGGVTFVNPFTPANDALVDRILPPLAVA